MRRHLLDTNTVSHLIRGHPQVLARVVASPTTTLCVSAVTAGELLFGLARRPQASRLRIAVRELLQRMDVLPWDLRVAESYAVLRTRLANAGTPLSPLDTKIAAHALALDIPLVSNDAAFVRVDGLRLEDWTKAPV